MSPCGNPLGARVVVRTIEEEKSAGGVLLPGTYKPDEGIVLAVGDGRMLENGTVIPVKVKVGDRVAYSSYSGSPITRDGVQYLVLAEKDLLVVWPATEVA